MQPAIQINGVTKKYENNFLALDDINLDIQTNEIFALLGPNGAGKSTLINLICGLVKSTTGSVSVFGHDTVKDYRQARSLIGLVPQELTTDAFETVWDTVSFTRGLFGFKPNPSYLEQLLDNLSLLDKKNNKLFTLSGGMKRRVLIAKALSHEPQILFLDEPTAGVDVKLRENMWEQVSALRQTGVTIILTTHYLEEAEKMADRIGVIRQGKLILVDQKQSLLTKLGQKTLQIRLAAKIQESQLEKFNQKVSLDQNGRTLIYNYKTHCESNNINELFQIILGQGLIIDSVETHQNSLQDIFVDLVEEK